MSDLADLAAAVGLGDDPPSHDYHHQPQMMMQPGNSNAFDEPEDHHVTHHHHLEHHDDSVEPEPIMVNHSDLHDHHDQDRHGGQHHQDHHSVHHGNVDSEHHDDDVQNDMLADHDATLREAVTADIDPSKVDPLTLAQHKEQIFIKLYKDKAIEAALLKKKLEQKSQEVKSLKAQLAALRKSSKSYFANGGSARMGEEPKAVPTATEATMDDKKPAATISIAVAQNPKYQYKYVRHVKWEERFQELVQYKLKHGHCNVPKSFPGPLHAWVRKQRVDRKAFTVSSGGGDMCQERIDALDSIGFTWVIGSNQPNECKWQESFDCLIQFKLKEGHCSVPKVYSAKLHKWVENQRHRRKLLEVHGPQKAKGMTWERVQKLEAIGFWENKKRQSLGVNDFGVM